MVKKKKVINIYPYKILSKRDLNTYSFNSIFSKENIEKNIKQYGEDYLLIITDKLDKNLFFGRFLKLKTDKPDILNTKNKTEHELNLGPNEEIKYDSHFILDLKNSLIFAEYNQSGVRHFPRPLEEYFKLIFSEEFEVQPIPTKNTLELVNKDDKIKSITIKLAKTSLSFKENEIGIPILRSIEHFSEGDLEIEVIISKKGRKGKIKPDELVKAIKKHLQKSENDKEDSLDILKVYSAEAVYDVLNDIFRSWRITIEYENKEQLNSKIWEELERIYSNNLNEILTQLVI